MNNINYHNIKARIESKTCPEHGEHPKFIKTLKGFSIRACCEDFKNKIAKKAEETVIKETKVAIEKIMRDAFK
ncbi:hypothetical protein HZQ07_18110 [Elizabethkingia anophelis]|nr:hypothetical protein [Elizabethkingia anophelis]MCT4319878.1 hypothetical protein [Elizabethkingia anophelis]